MKKITRKNTNKALDRKYKIVNNSLRQIAKNNPKDLVAVEIGDTKQPDFYPQVKINRWGDDEETNEVNFSVRYKDDDYTKGGLELEGELIKWKKGNREVHMYDKPEASSEGGYEIELHLKEKPDTNVFDFTIETKGLNFYYQPELTEKEKEEGAHRPENVVGSYAVYHKTKRDNRVGGKEYKTGKAFHIYRPKVIDADGNETWGELNIDEKKKLLTVTVPQFFLDKAVYPIVVDPTFGYETIGSSYSNLGIGVSPAILSANGTLQKITAAVDASGDGEDLATAIWGNDRVLIEDGGLEQMNTNGMEWHDFEGFTASLTAGDFRLGIYTDGPEYPSIARDETDDDRYWNSGNQNSAPDPVPDWDRTGIFSIYATYTTSSIGTETDTERDVELTGKETIDSEKSITLEGVKAPNLKIVEQIDQKVRLTWNY